jgi:hypothetical protein
MFRTLTAIILKHNGPSRLIDYSGYCARRGCGHSRYGELRGRFRRVMRSDEENACSLRRWRQHQAGGSLLGCRRVKDFLSRTVACFAWTGNAEHATVRNTEFDFAAFAKCSRRSGEHRVDRGLREQHRAVADRSVGGGCHGGGGEGGLVVDRGQRADAEVGVEPEAFQAGHAGSIPVIRSLYELIRRLSQSSVRAPARLVQPGVVQTGLMERFACSG